MKSHQSFSSNFDMLAAATGSQTILEPIHYMEENPFKTVANSKATKRKLSTKKGNNNKKSLTRQRTSETHKRSAELRRCMKAEKHQGNGQEQVRKENTNDPLFTPQTFLKCELGEEESCREEEEESDKFLNSDEDKDFSDEEYAEDDKEYEIKRRKNYRQTVSVDDDDDEPLTRTRARSARGTSKKARHPRLKDCQETCKHKCTTRFQREQRLDIYHFYWQLSHEHKINFLRAHVRKPVVKYLQRQSLRSTCCYYLKAYKMETPDLNKQSVERQPPLVKAMSFSPDDEDLTKVCRKFFTGTLKVSDQEIKEAIKDFELIPERIKRPNKHTEDDDVTKSNTSIEKKPQQYLDPETGDLSETKPKNQTKRRKRNEPAPKRFPKPTKCSIRCKFKCHEKFSEEERKQICDVFWSLDYQRRKDFVLSRIEIKDVKTPLNPEYRKTNRPTRSYQTKFYLRSGPKTENVRVCKHFMERTLCVNRCFIENAIEFADKTTGAYTSFDRRGQNVPHNKTSDERKQTVLDHIRSYPIWIPHEKSKIKCLHYSLSIKKMFDAYKEKCLAEGIEPLPLHYYYKVFHADFRMLFLTNPNPKKGRGYYKTNPNICHYTGEETGGFWVDNKGTKLDLRFINPALTLDVNRQRSAILSNAAASGSTERGGALNLVYNPLGTFVEQQQSLNPAIIKSDVSLASYGNLSADSPNILRMP